MNNHDECYCYDKNLCRHETMSKEQIMQYVKENGLKTLHDCDLNDGDGVLGLYPVGIYLLGDNITDKKSSLDIGISSPLLNGSIYEITKETLNTYVEIIRTGSRIWKRTRSNNLGIGKWSTTLPQYTILTTDLTIESGQKSGKVLNVACPTGYTYENSVVVSVEYGSGSDNYYTYFIKGDISVILGVSNKGLVNENNYYSVSLELDQTVSQTITYNVKIVLMRVV